MMVNRPRCFNVEAHGHRTKASPPVRPGRAREDAIFFAPATLEKQAVMTDLLRTKLSRRSVLQAAAVGAAGVSPALRTAVYAQGSDAPEKKEVRIGFIPLTDCASVVMASVLGIDQKYGVKIIPTKEASWAGVRDKLVNGELDMAHVLWGLIYGVHLGTEGDAMALELDADQLARLDAASAT